MELINEVSDECLWGEVHNPLLIPAALKTSLSIGVWCEALIFQSTEHYTVFHIQSTASFDFCCKENSTAVSQPGYPTNQEHAGTNSSNALAKPVLKVVPVAFRIPPCPCTAPISILLPTSVMGQGRNLLTTTTSQYSPTSSPKTVLHLPWKRW